MIVFFNLHACIILSFILEFQDMPPCWSFHFNYLSPRQLCTFNLNFNKFILGKFSPIISFSLFFFRFIVLFICWIPGSSVHTFSIMICMSLFFYSFWSFIERLRGEGLVILVLFSVASSELFHLPNIFFLLCASWLFCAQPACFLFPGVVL